MFAALSLLNCVCLSALAQSSEQTQRAAQQAQQIQSQIQQRQQSELDQLSRRPSTLEDAAPSPAAAVVDDKSLPTGNCRPVDAIRLEGADHLLFLTQEGLTEPYRGRCLDAKRIAALMSDITRYYLRRGDIGARVYLPNQDSSRELKLRVVEGTIEGFELDDKSRGTVDVTTIFPGLEGRPLNLRDIEQGEDQANALASNHVTTEIVPGSSAGGSIVKVHNEPQAPWHLWLSYDNFGTPATGKIELTASATLDNPFRLDDAINLSHEQSPPKDRPGSYSQTDTVGYTLPFGKNTFSAGYMHSVYLREQRLPSGSTYPARGSSGDAFAKWNRLLYRDQGSRLNAAATVSVMPLSNYFAGQLLPEASPKLSVLDLDLLWNRSLWSGLLSLDVGESQGLTAFGAQRDTHGQPATLPRAQFRKARASVQYSRSFDLHGRTADWNSQLNVQHSNDVLYGAEQMLVGGLSTVRGFMTNTISGEQGFFWRNDLGVHVPATIASRSVDLKPYVAFDIGRAVSRYADLRPGGTISGAAAGVNANWVHMNLETFFTHWTGAPAWMPKERGALYFKLALAM